MFKFLPGTHLVNTAICVKNVHSLSFTSLESKKSPQIVFYEWSQCKNVSRDQLATGMCTPFGFWNATSITIDRLGVLVYPQNKPVDCTHVLGIAFINMFQLYLHHCNITVVDKTENTNSSFSFANSVYLSNSEFVRVMFSSIVCYRGSFYLTKGKNIEIANNMIVGGIEMHESSFATISYCNVSLLVDGLAIIDIKKSRNVDISGDFSHSDNNGISIQHTNHTRIINVTVSNCSETGLDLSDSIDTQVLNVTILFSETGISIMRSNKSALQDVDLWHIDFGIYMHHLVNANLNNVYVSGSTDEVFTAHKSVSLTIKNLTAVNWTKHSFSFSFTTDTTVQNLTIKPVKAKTSQMEYSESIISSSNITIENSLFSGSLSYSTPTDITRQPTVLEIYNSSVEMANCSFENNNITPINLIHTRLTVSGNLNFTNNTAYRGGAMVFFHNNHLSFSENSRVTFVGNRAVDTGGAIYIVTNTFHYTRHDVVQDNIMICKNCFLKLFCCSNSAAKQLIFTNNSAGQGGNVVYGGGMGSTCKDDYRKIKTSCLSRFLEISVINPKTLSPISSDPSRVCFCNESGIPDCWTLYHPTEFSIYPGQKISISAVVVGQNFGTVAGSVFAQFLYNKHLPQPQLDVRESAQEVKHIHCNQLVYTIFSPVEDYHTELILTAVKRSITETYKVITQPIQKGRTDDESDDIMDTPVYVRVNLIPCPPGFLLNASDPPKCDCNNQLLSLPDVACNIQYSTLQRRGLVWIGPLTDDNGTITDVVSSENCPLNYCKDEAVSFQLNASSAQCNYNHSGLMCGGCQPDLSLALGTAQCLKCSNKYLALLIPFALAGVVLVLFIKLLDLTVSRGLINGLIFYANIIKPNEYLFLPQGNTNPLTLFISWLNLDLGIETCFFSGLTAYGKAWLQFVFPFYIWAIAGLIIASARYSIRVARITGYNSVPVLATLFLLSYAKLLRTIITVMSYTIVDYPQGSKVVWSADGNIDYLGPKHAPLFVAALATLLFLWLPYTLLLLLGQWLRRFDNRLVTRMLMKIKPFLDAHYGPLKDKHYYWFGALLFIRIAILLISAVIPANNFSIFILSISVSAGALVSFTAIGPAVYRSKVTSAFETALFINLALLGLVKYHVYIAGGNQAAVTYLLIGVAFAQFLGLVTYRVYSVLKPFFSYYHKRFINNNNDDEDDDEEREGVWRFETSLPLQEIPRRLATPYENASTAVH